MMKLEGEPLHEKLHGRLVLPKRKSMSDAQLASGATGRRLSQRAIKA